MSNNFFKPAIAVGLLACLWASIVAAQSPGTAPTIPVDPRTQRIQDQAEEVFERADYKRAFFIYRNELAPIGDKFGQYMVGYMYLTGKGVEQDQAMASAWYRLAAERGTPEFVSVSEELKLALNDQQRARSDELFLGLRKQYGDLALVLISIRHDYEELRRRTGSVLGAGSSPMTVIVDVNGVSTTMSGDDYYGRIERRLRSKLQYVASQTDIDIIDFDIDSFDMSSIEQKVTARLDQID